MKTIFTKKWDCNFTIASLFTIAVKNSNVLVVPVYSDLL